MIYLVLMCLSSILSKKDILLVGRFVESILYRLVALIWCLGFFEKKSHPLESKTNPTPPKSEPRCQVGANKTPTETSPKKTRENPIGSGDVFAKEFPDLHPSFLPPMARLEKLKLFAGGSFFKDKRMFVVSGAGCRKFEQVFNIMIDDITPKRMVVEWKFVPDI